MLMNDSIRSPAYRFGVVDPQLHTLPTLNEDEFVLDEEEQSEFGPLPISSPRLGGFLARKFSSFNTHSKIIESDNYVRTEPKTPTNADTFLSLLIYSLVNVAVSVPSLYGYAGIIYRDPVFKTSMPDLIRLVIFSSAVHQLVFSGKSSLTFAIAQVQDAGLIFLSTMASVIASSTSSPEEATSTAVIVLSLATASLGAVILSVGRFRLASFVSLIPMPVVAGYLAFIGFFCFAAGLGLSCSKDISTWQDLTQLNEARDWILATPAIISGALMTFVSRKSTKWWALPVTIVLIPLTFFIYLRITGTSLEASREAGWVAPLEPPKPFSHIFLYFNFQKVRWSVVPKLFFTWASMSLLVTFASALDVVAVEMDLGGQELDLDNELQTVGLSNIISGMLGGYTGSYIFSMTIFTRRTGSLTRWIGLILAFVELFLFCAPFDLMSYVPRFFFAATLIFIALDLMTEWIFHVAFRVSYREYALVLLTFISITYLDDLVVGILIGCLGAIVNFISLYSSIDPVVPAQTSSNILRDYEARKILNVLTRDRIITLKLSGFLFFGSTTLLLSRVREFITGLDHIPPPVNPSYSSSISTSNQVTSNQLQLNIENPSADLEKQIIEEKPLLSSEKTSSYGSVDSSVKQELLLQQSEAAKNERTVLGVALRKRRSASANDLFTLSNHSTIRTDSTETENVSPLVELNKTYRGQSIDEINQLEQDRLGLQKEVRFLVLDFFAVTNVDATAVSTGLLRVRMLAQAHNVRLVFCSLRPQFEQLFRANNVVGPGVIVRNNLNDALDFCETALLEEIKGRESQNNGISLLKTSRILRYPSEPSVPLIIFEEFDDDPNTIAQKKRAEKRARASLSLLMDTFFGWGKGRPSMTPEQTKRLATFFKLLPKRQGQVIFDIGEDSDVLYVVLSGEVGLYKCFDDWTTLPKEERVRIINGTREGVVFGKQRERMQRARYGSMIGDLSFTLQEKRAFGAMAETDTSLFALSRAQLKEMETSDPNLAVGLHKMIGRSLGMTVSNLQELTTDE